MKLRSLTPLMLLVSGTCLAHGELPTAGWCEGGRISVVATVNLSGPALKETRDRCPKPGQGPVLKECGQFDDDYAFARGAAMTQCQTHAWQNPIGDLGTVLFVPEGPGTFLADDHHAQFMNVHGVWGSCVRCDALPAVSPVLPSRD